MRRSVLAVALLLIWFLPCWAAPKQESEPVILPEHVAELGDRDEEVRKAAIGALVERGPAAVAGLRAALPGTNTRLLRSVLAVLEGIRGDEADRLIAELAVMHPHPAMRASAAAMLKGRSGQVACDTVIALAHCQNAMLRDRAVDLIRELRDPRYIDRLIERLEDTPQPKRTGSMGLGIDATRSDLRGHDNYSTTYNIAGRKVVQKQVMPIIGETSIHTQVTVSTGSVLHRVTGRSFRQSARKWRKWWNANREQYGRPR